MKDTVWYVYILRCLDKSFYTGITNNLERRLKEHNTGNGAKYTKGRKPVTLVYREKHPNQSLARQREAQIKKCGRRKKEKLIREFAQRKLGKIPRRVPTLSGLARDKGGL